MAWSRSVNITVQAGYHRSLGWIYSQMNIIPRSCRPYGKIPFSRYTHLNFKLWFNETRRNRARNNSRTHHSYLRQTVVHPLYSFYNHSCDPTAVDRTELFSIAEKTSKFVMMATKEVKGLFGTVAWEKTPAFNASFKS
jgi:hypothetical protein